MFYERNCAPECISPPFYQQVHLLYSKIRLCPVGLEMTKISKTLQWKGREWSDCLRVLKQVQHALQ